MRKFYYLCLMGLLFTNASCIQEKPEFMALSGPYLGQNPPGMTPEIFAPGIVCTEKNEGYMTFLDGGLVLVFDRWMPDSDDTEPYYVTFMKGGRWTLPRPTGHKQNPYDSDLPITRDASTFYFASNRNPMGEGEAETGWDIWMTRWNGQEFVGNRRLDEPVSSEHRDAWASVAENGNLYFMSNRPGSYGRWDIYKAEIGDGGFTSVENLGPKVSSEYSEADPAIAPDESYVLFCSTRPDCYGEMDLYAAFRKPDGTWTEPHNLGPDINTPFSDEKPYISPDGRYIFYSNDASGHLDIYWVDARIIEPLRRAALE